MFVILSFFPHGNTYFLQNKTNPFIILHALELTCVFPCVTELQIKRLGWQWYSEQVSDQWVLLTSKYVKKYNKQFEQDIFHFASCTWSLHNTVVERLIYLVEAQEIKAPFPWKERFLRYWVWYLFWDPCFLLQRASRGNTKFWSFQTTWRRRFWNCLLR